jgi:ketosteroid isomerase-like protein
VQLEFSIRAINKTVATAYGWQEMAWLQTLTSKHKPEETMDIDRRHLVLPALAIGLLGILPALAASADEDAVANGVEAFRVAQLATDAKALDALCAAELSYSHSDAHVEDKATFLANATKVESGSRSLEYRDVKIRVVGEAAIVRFHWVSERQSADGKKSGTNLHILMNWQKQGADWKLLSRAATKL